MHPPILLSHTPKCGVHLRRSRYFFMATKITEIRQISFWIRRGQVTVSRFNISREVRRLSGQSWETWASCGSYWTKDYVEFEGNRQSKSRRRFDLISRLCTVHLRSFGPSACIMYEYYYYCGEVWLSKMHLTMLSLRLLIRGR